VIVFGEVDFTRLNNRGRMVAPAQVAGNAMPISQARIQEFGPPSSVPLSLPRRVVCDLIYFAHKIPSVPVQQVIDVSRVASVRTNQTDRVGWCTIFTKAFAIVAQRMPELRRAYVEYPFARLYQHPYSVASVAVEREVDGQPGVFFAYIPAPEATPLPELEAILQRYKEAPIAEVFGFIIRFYRFPRFIRRALWWYILNVRGSRKAQFLGTFGVSVYSALGAESLHPLSPLTTTMNYGIIGPDGRVPVRIIYDHRAMDGATVARALGLLSDVLNAEIYQELAELAGTSTEAVTARGTAAGGARK